MILKEYNELWQFATRHGAIQQDKSELEHVFNLIKDCKTYLEIGSAEGASLAVLGANMERVSYVDRDEDHTRIQRDEVLKTLKSVNAYHGNSHDNGIISKLSHDQFDVVFIDAGHSYEDVIADAIAYGRLATKYILFHDVQIASVRKALEWYMNQNKFKSVDMFINSRQYGYGIITP